MSKLDEFFESEIFEWVVRRVVFTIWLASGAMWVLPYYSTMPMTQWAFGFLFGILFTSMSTWIVYTIITFACEKSPKFEAILDKILGIERDE